MSTSSKSPALSAATKTSDSVAPLRKSVRVCRSAADAFRLFTAELESWWPLRTHSVSGDRTRLCAFECHRGGQIYEEDQDGKRFVWGTVLVWDPPYRLAFTWHPGRAEDTRQEVEVRFLEQGDETRLELVHTGWERLGNEALETRGRYDSGWQAVLEAYASRT
ncbi:MAG TPA: SRPBCC family protein [Thermoanaerobaculia bacterium]|nr:SRPBCC family protein [Thermoanaerobaculia bacterium]